MVLAAYTKVACVVVDWVVGQDAMYIVVVEVFEYSKVGAAIELVVMQLHKDLVKSAASVAGVRSHI
jgi:hypothetical protein